MRRLRIPNPSPLQWTIIVATGTLTLGLAGAAYAARRRARGRVPVGPVLPPGKRDPDIDPQTPGSGKLKPGKKNQGPPPLPNGWGGGQYGPGPIPADFDWNGNLIYISPDCQTIAEAWKFLPIPGFQLIEKWWMPVNGGPSAQGSLADALRFVSAAGETGTAWGYIARLVALAARDGVALDEEYLARPILEEALAIQTVLPTCPNVFAADVGQLSPALEAWWDNFMTRMIAGVDAFETDWYFWNPLWEVS